MISSGKEVPSSCSPTVCFTRRGFSEPSLTLFEKVGACSQATCEQGKVNSDLCNRTMSDPSMIRIFHSQSSDRFQRIENECEPINLPLSPQRVLPRADAQSIALTLMHTECLNLAIALNDALLPNPYVLPQDQDMDVIFDVVKHLNVSMIADYFQEFFHRDLLINLPLFLESQSLESVLIPLILNDQFRQENYCALRHTIHQLPQKTRVRLLMQLDQVCSSEHSSERQLFDKTLRLREYADQYPLNRFDLVSNPASLKASDVSLLSGSAYLFDGLCAKLAQTKNKHDHFHMIMHEYLDGEFVKAFNQLLIKKHNAGVKIRMILCQGGSWQWESHHPFYSHKDKQAVNELIEAGIEVKVHPFTYGLEHQKGIIYKANGQLGMMMGGGTICDQTAYPSGEPIADSPRDALGFAAHRSEAIPEYYDMMIEAQGDPAIIWQTQFLEKWLYLGGQIDESLTDEQIVEKYFSSTVSATNEPTAQPSMSRDAHMKILYNVPYTQPTAHPYLLKALEQAQESIHIEIPYLLLEDVLSLCEEKAKTGVKVNYLLPGDSPRLAEWVTNLAMTHWIKKQLTLPSMDIRLCKDRYNHGKIIAIDLETDHATAFVMTGNLEPILSGGRKGGIVYDSTCMLTSMTRPILDNIREIIHRDFSDDFSKSLARSDFDNQHWLKSVGAALLYHKINLFQ